MFLTANLKKAYFMFEVEEYISSAHVFDKYLLVYLQVTRIVMNGKGRSLSLNL